MAKISVRATERGFYGSLREPGEVFEIDAPSKGKRTNADGKVEDVTVDPYSERWMERVEAEKPAKEEKQAKPAK